MADNQDTKFAAHAQKNKSVFVLGMVRVVLQACVVIVKDRLSFLERYSVLSFVDFGLIGIPR
jgi:hypothetical protein